MPITKFFRVAQSGKTIDGREITPAQIDEMAASYNPKTYGARVNLEHFLSIYPDSVFKAYGDVLALKAEDGDNGTRVLLAQIDAFPDLVKLKQAGQKVYWSIEIAPNFAGTGKAYLAGLAATDNPASLGTEMLTFAAIKAPDKVKTSLYSAAFQADFDLDEPKDNGPSILDKVKSMFGAQSQQAQADKTQVDQRFAQTEAAITEVAGKLAEVTTKLSGLADAATVKSVAADLAALTSKLSNTPNQPQRPQVSGADANQTDC